MPGVSVKRKAPTASVTSADMSPPTKKTKTVLPARTKSSYTPQQKLAIQEFCSITQSDKSSAAKQLKNHGWNVNAAVNAYYSSNAAANPARSPLNKIFDSYRENAAEDPDEVAIDGTMKMLGQLQIEPDDIGALVFSEIVASPSLGKMIREGFVDGWSELSVDSLPKMRNVILQRRSELATNVDLFKNVYTHTFQLALQPGSKTLPIDMAVEFWRMLFVSPGFNWRTANSPWLDWWLEFQSAKQTKAVNKDLWKQTLAFARETVRDETLSFWSDESSWPSVVDEFVAWVREEKHAGGEDAMAVDSR